MAYSSFTSFIEQSCIVDGIDSDVGSYIYCIAGDKSES